MTIESNIRIPRSRIGVLIGKGGSTKKQLETLTGVELTIDSEDGSVIIRSTPNIPDPSYIWKTREIIRAIARGFNADRAFLLIDDEIYLETIELEGTKNNIKRLKSRLIGEGGKARKMIEISTSACISIFGNQVSIIGELNEIGNAKEAITLLINGSKHSTVFRFLEQLRFRSRMKPPKIWKDKSFDEELTISETEEEE
ncbi:MAG: RNA-processing protein [Candidatus Heimdallarchaeota archaeon]|nr:RNA-processing protein [Candidatus Heimdallarchaeota archaeon]